MSTIYTISSATETINENNDTVQIDLIFTIDSGSASYSFTFKEKNILVKDYGSITWEYSFDDLVVLPAIQKLEITDGDGYLKFLLFNATIVDKRFEMVLSLNGTEVYSGFSDERSMEYNIIGDGGRLIVEFVPKTDILRNTAMYDEEGTYLNPFGYSTNVWAGYSDPDNMHNVRNIIEDIYQFVNSGISLVDSDINFNQTWTYKGYAIYDDTVDVLIDETVYNDTFVFADILMYTYAMIQFMSSKIDSVYDVLKFIAQELFCYTGMYNNETAFFRRLFYYDSTHIQTLGTILEHKLTYQYGLAEWVKIYDYAWEIPPWGTAYHDETEKGTYTPNSNLQITNENNLVWFFETLTGDSSSIYAIDADYWGAMKAVSIGAAGSGYVASEILTVGQVGSLTAISIALGGAGAGYSVGTLVSLDDDGTGGVAEVTAIAGSFGFGRVTAIEIVSGGKDYIASNTSTTTVISGTGTGLQIDIDSVATSGNGQVQIDTVDGSGGVTGISIYDPGTGYVAGTTYSTTGGSGTNCTITVDEVYTGYFRIQTAKDTDIDTNFYEHHKLLAELWWKHRGDYASYIYSNAQYEYFKVSGVDYSFTKCFISGGYKYQPTKLQINISDGTSEFIAINLGSA